LRAGAKTALPIYRVHDVFVNDALIRAVPFGAIEFDLG
jgi:hypothetical protein